jgi:hypothetical protein
MTQVKENKMNRQVLNPVGMSRDPIENRPALFLPTQTNEELLSFAESYASTALEKELTSRLKGIIDACVSHEEEMDEMITRVDMLENQDSYCCNCGNPT